MSRGRGARMLHGPAAGAINSGPPRRTGRASGLRASNQAGATRVIALERDGAELVASALPGYLACIEALRKDRLARALSAASERRGSSAGRIGLRSGLHFEVGNSRDLTKTLGLAIMPSVRETPTDEQVECVGVVDLTTRLFGSSRLVVTGELNGVDAILQ